MSGILVLGELDEKGLRSITFDLLSIGRRLAGSMDEEVAIALLGNEVEGLSAEAISRGADRVHLVQDPLLGEPHVDAHLSAFESLCRTREPSVVLIGRTSLGSDIAPRLAFRLGVAVAQDCVDVDMEAGTKRLVASRPFWPVAMAR